MTKKITLLIWAMLIASVLNSEGQANGPSLEKCQKKYKVVHDKLTATQCQLTCAQTLLESTFKKEPMQIAKEEQNTYKECVEKCSSPEEKQKNKEKKGKGKNP